MRAFEITHPKFGGFVTVLYGENGLLAQITFKDAEFQEGAHLQVFKSMIPVQLQDFSGTTWAKEAVWIETIYEITFDMFWTAYRRKINRIVCLRLWDKLSRVDQGKAVHGIRFYESYLNRISWRKKADPETYLRQHYWDNDWRNLNE